MKKALFTAIAIASTLNAMAQSWNPVDPREYESSVRVIAGFTFNNEEATPDTKYKIGAFVGDECRTVFEMKNLKPVGTSTSQYYGELQIPVKASENDGQIILKAYDEVDQLTYQYKTPLSIDVNSMALGTMSDRVMFDYTVVPSDKVADIVLNDGVVITKGDTDDLHNYLYYISEDSNGEPARQSLGEGLSRLEVEWESSNTSALKIENDKYYAIGSTSVSGLTVKAKFGNRILTATWFVTPYLQELADIAIDENVEVGLNETVDLKTHVSILYSTGVDENGTITYSTVKYADLTEPISLTFRAASADNTKFSVTADGMVTGLERTTAAGGGIVSVIITGTTLKAETNIIVTPIIVPLESLTLAKTDITMSRLANVEYSIIATPANATFDASTLALRFSNDNVTAAIDPATLKATFTAQHVGKATAALWCENKEYQKEIKVEVGADYTYTTGWNWMSLYKTTPALSSIEALNGDNYFNESLLEIRSQFKLAINDAIYGWFGSLTELASDCYHVYSNSRAQFVIYGGIDPTYDNTLYKGWNWIFNPYADSYGIEAIALSVMASEGDIIKTKTNGFATYTNGAWVADPSFQISYGEGMMYYANNATTLNWAATPGTPAAGARGRQSRNRESTWQYDASRYSTNMSVIAQAKGMTEGMTIGAFCGDECRGEGMVVEANGELYLFITVHGEAGEQISFRSFDGISYNDINETIKFTQMAGSIREPLTLNVNGTNGINGLAAERADAIITDVNGKRVAQSFDELPSGIYMITRGGYTTKVVK